MTLQLVRVQFPASRIKFHSFNTKECQILSSHSVGLCSYVPKKNFHSRGLSTTKTDLFNKTNWRWRKVRATFATDSFNCVKCLPQQFSDISIQNNRQGKRNIFAHSKPVNLVPSAAQHNLEQRRSFKSTPLIRPGPGRKWSPGSIPSLDSVKTVEFEDRLFDYLCDGGDKVRVSHFINALTSTGLRETDPRLRECMQKLSQYRLTSEPYKIGEYNRFGPKLDREAFKDCISQNIVLIASAFRNQFIIPDFGQFCQDVEDLYWQARENINGHVATYIPQLARYSPNYWGVAVCSVDGQRYAVGDTNVPFCIQSVSKPLTYAMVLDDLSPKVVHEYVGHEPSGVAFNTIGLDYRDKPHNPMVNAGSIVVCSLLKQNYNLADRFDYVSNTFKRTTGGEYVAFNNSVFLSERETADRNFALGYYMREKKCFPEGTNLMEVLDFYFQMCSLEVTCESGAVMAATLANGGVCPITGDKVFSSSSVRDTMSLMLTCGMYDYSGEFAFRVGLPAKSGVAGGIMIVVPNKMGFFIWSPALDQWGNSVRGVQFASDLVRKFNFHHYDNMKFTTKKRDPCQQKVESQAADVANLLFSAYNSDISALRRCALSDYDMDQADYDGRTALHVGAAEGHEAVVKFLLDKCKCNPFVVDRWSFTPLDDAKRFGHEDIATLLKERMDNYNASEKIDRRFEKIDSTKYQEIAFKVDNSAGQGRPTPGIKYVDNDDSIYDLEGTSSSSFSLPSSSSSSSSPETSSTSPPSTNEEYGNEGMSDGQVNDDSEHGESNGLPDNNKDQEIGESTISKSEN